MSDPLIVGVAVPEATVELDEPSDGGGEDPGPGLLPPGWFGALDVIDAVLMALEDDFDLQGLIDERVWADQAPADAVLPYVVVVEVAEKPTYESPDEDGVVGLVDDLEFQVSCFAEGRALSRELARLVVTALHDAPLSFAEGTLLYLRRGKRLTQLDPDKSPTGGDVWHTLVTFRALSSRAY